ncbi:hypothetical protein DIPPA_18377 [Diplonema papillatum]|nr:hypothetical protein DIPPA_18377 [Diplonema papillatum]
MATCAEYFAAAKSLPVCIGQADANARADAFVEMAKGKSDAQDGVSGLDFAEWLAKELLVGDRWKQPALVAAEALHATKQIDGDTSFTPELNFIQAADLRTLFVNLQRHLDACDHAGAAYPGDGLLLGFEQFNDLRALFFDWGAGHVVADARQAFRDAGATESGSGCALLSLPAFARFCVMRCSETLPDSGCGSEQWIVLAPAAIVRETRSLSSPQVGDQLTEGAIVTITDIIGRRAFITSPYQGWLSLTTCRGELILDRLSNTSTPPVAHDVDVSLGEAVDTAPVPEARLPTAAALLPAKHPEPRSESLPLSTRPRMKRSLSSSSGPARNFAKPTQSMCRKIEDPCSGQADFGKYPWDFQGYVAPLNDERGARKRSGSGTGSNKSAGDLKYAFGKPVAKSAVGSASFKSATTRELPKPPASTPQTLGPGAYTEDDRSKKVVPRCRSAGVGFSSTTRDVVKSLTGGRVVSQGGKLVANADYTPASSRGRPVKNAYEPVHTEASGRKERGYMQPLKKELNPNEQRCRSKGAASRVRRPIPDGENAPPAAVMKKKSTIKKPAFGSSAKRQLPTRPTSGPEVNCYQYL